MLERKYILPIKMPKNGVKNQRFNQWEGKISNKVWLIKIRKFKI